MENSYCYKHFLFSGMHPDRPLVKWRIIANNLLTSCFFLLALVKCYQDGDFEPMEFMSSYFIMTAKYLGLVFGRRTVKRLLESMKYFWKIDTEDETVIDFLKHSARVEKMYKYMFLLGVSTHAMKPFIAKGSSIFSCYVPPQIPFPLFYIVESYVLIIGASLFVSFNIFVCSLIMSVVVQFRVLNLRIKELNSMEVVDGQDFERYVRDLHATVKYQQFLIRRAEDLNELLHVPLALLMITSVTILCVIMYVLTVHQGSTLDDARIVVTGIAIIIEFFMVYGLPSQLLMDESIETASVIYHECKWYLPILRPLRKDFLIIIARSQKGVCIRAANYHVVSNRTVVLILKTAYTFYTFLQRVAVINNN